jgi:hypothetical protein
LARTKPSRGVVTSVKIAKAKFKGQETFNDYELELSWGQLQAIYRALEHDHADPLADELFAELGYYLQNVPGPGESDEEYKEARDAESQANEMGEEPNERNNELVGDEIEEPPAGEEIEGTESPVGPETAEGEPPFRPEGEPREADEYLEEPPMRGESMMRHRMRRGMPRPKAQTGVTSMSPNQQGSGV